MNPQLPISIVSGAAGTDHPSVFARQTVDEPTVESHRDADRESGNSFLFTPLFFFTPSLFDILPSSSSNNNNCLESAASAASAAAGAPTYVVQTQIDDTDSWTLMTITDSTHLSILFSPPSPSPRFLIFSLPSSLFLLLFQSFDSSHKSNTSTRSLETFSIVSPSLTLGARSSRRRPTPPTMTMVGMPSATSRVQEEEGGGRRKRRRRREQKLVMLLAKRRSKNHLFIFKCLHYVGTNHEGVVEVV